MQKNNQSYIRIVTVSLAFLALNVEAQNGVVHPSFKNKNIVKILEVNSPRGFSTGDSNAHASTNSAHLRFGLVAPPSAPDITNITTGNGYITVAFTAPTDNGVATITDYKYSTNGGRTYTSAGTITSPISIIGLKKGTHYQVMLRAVNSAGDGKAVLVCLIHL